jgi:hypothetical protein
MVQGDGWLDVSRSLALWNDVFSGHKSTVAEGRWIDHPSASLPLLYVFTGAELADALRAEGRGSEARPIASLAAQVGKAAGFGDLVQQLDASANAPAANDSAGVVLRVDPRTQPQTKSTDPAVVRKK